MYEVYGHIEVTKNDSKNLQGFHTKLVEKQRTESLTTNGKYENRRVSYTCYFKFYFLVFTSYPEKISDMALVNKGFS